MGKQNSLSIFKSQFLSFFALECANVPQPPFLFVLILHLPPSWCPFHPGQSRLIVSLSCNTSPRLAWPLCFWPRPVLSLALLGAAGWLCAGGSVCCLLCGGLRDEDQYLLRHSSPALDHESPCGQHMLLAHLEHQDKEQLQCTLARLENENRSVSGT